MVLKDENLLKTNIKLKTRQETIPPQIIDLRFTITSMPFKPFAGSLVMTSYKLSRKLEFVCCLILLKFSLAMHEEQDQRTLKLCTGS